MTSRDFIAETAPVHDRALRHSVTDHVLEAVRSGKLGQGDRVHETLLARALDVSLSPVRESLFRLADQGWLEHRPRRGFYVRTFGAAETQEVFTFRAMLESFAAYRVALRWSNGDPTQGHQGDQGGRAQEIQQMQDARREMSRLIEEGERAGLAGDTRMVWRCNASFHDMMMRLAGNALLERSWAMLAPAEWLLQSTWVGEPPRLSVPEVTDWVARHRRLLELLFSKDVAGAAAEARDHVEEAGESNLRRRFPAVASSTRATAGATVQTTHSIHT